MADILHKIAAYKREEIAAAKRARPLATLEGHAGSDSARAARRAIRLRAAVVLMGSALWNCA